MAERTNLPEQRPAEPTTTAAVPESPAPAIGARPGGALLQRKIARRLAQRAARGDDGVTSDAAQHVETAAASSGSPLPGAVQGKFESSLGADLSAVRVHTGGASEAAADAVGARAYTVGNDIHFGAGQFDPSSRGGEHLLAHEVAHTVQQSGGMARKAQFKLDVSSPGDSLEHEADAAADAMVAGVPATTSATEGLQRKVYRDPDPKAQANPAPAGGQQEAAPAAGAGEKKDTTDEITPIRKELLSLFEVFNGKAIGDKEFDDIETQTAWDNTKKAEAEAQVKLDADWATWNAMSPEDQKANPKKKPLMKTVPHMTTCIQTQGVLLGKAFKNAKLKMKGKRGDFGPAAIDNAEKIGPDVMTIASIGMATRPKVGDILVYVSRGGAIDKAAATADYANQQVATKTKNEEKADAALDAAQAAADSAKAALDELAAVENANTGDLAKLKAAYKKAADALKWAQAGAEKANKELKSAQGVADSSAEKLDKARKDAKHGRKFEFSHVGFLAAAPVVQPDGKELWETFDGGQKVWKGKDSIEGSKRGRRIYDPKTNEISGEAQQGGAARWFEGWVDVDKLVE